MRVEYSSSICAGTFAPSQQQPEFGREIEDRPGFDNLRILHLSSNIDDKQGSLNRTSPGQQGKARRRVEIGISQVVEIFNFKWNRIDGP